ncbi:MAG: EF-hand domain-containing protein [Asticcacaulis sp.]
MSKIFYATALSAMAFGLAATAAMAQGWGGPLGMLGRYDADSNGQVSADEYTAGRGQQFTSMDSNGDGKVSRDEFTAYTQQMMAQWGGGNGGGDPQRQQHRIDDFMAADTDGDGLVSSDEYKAAGDARFKSIDTNGDGMISGDEVQAMMHH